METALTMPLAVVLITLGIYVMEADLSRHESAVYARGSAMVASDLNLRNPFVCTIDDSATGNRTDVDQVSTASCSNRNGELGLPSSDRFWRKMRSSASAYPVLIRDVELREPVNDVLVSGTGSVGFDRSTNFFESQGAPQSSSRFQVVKEEFWDHNDRRWAEGHDRAFWTELSKRGTYQLFPNVFPSR